MTDKEKLIELQKMTRLTWKDLAAKIGIPSAQTFTDIRAGRHGISMKLANRITAAYPNVRMEWLTLGIGPMTTGEEDGAIPFYEAADGISPGRLSGTIDIGTCFPKADAAVRNTDAGMAEYPVGCILVLKRVLDMGLLVPGCNYLVGTSEFTAVKRLQKGSDGAHVALYSTCQATYPDGRPVYEPFEIPLESVRDIFSVLGYIYTQATDANKL